MSKNFKNGLTNGQMGGKIKRLQKPFFVKILSTRRPQFILSFSPLCASGLPPAENVSATRSAVK